MRFKDPVYGECEITEPVLLEIIAGPTLQRLKEIDQSGYYEPHFPGSSRSRYEHSVGVCILLQRYGAPLAEQIAGLIHDVSHSAFSHCIDYVLKEGTEKTQSHQDNIHDDFVKKSEIPAILEKYGFTTEYILDDTHFPLKEKDLPDLCADRIDYSLRGAIAFGVMPSTSHFLEHLIAKEGRWIFDNFEYAKLYTELFRTLNGTYYSGMPSAVMHLSVADYLRHALDRGYINKGDLYTTDNAVLAKIEPYLKSDERLALFFERMNNRIPFENNPNDYHGTVFCKSRAVDPLCMHEGEVRRVSEIESDWERVVKAESKPKQYFIKFAK